MNDKSSNLRLLKPTPEDPPVGEMERIVSEAVALSEVPAEAAVAATPSSLPTDRPPHADQSVVSTLDAEQEEKAKLIHARERALAAMNHLLELCVAAPDSSDQDPVSRMWETLKAYGIAFERHRLGRMHQRCIYWQEEGGTIADFEEAGAYFGDLGEKLLIAQEQPPAPVHAPTQSAIATLDGEQEINNMTDRSKLSLKAKLVRDKSAVSVSTTEARAQVDKTGDEARAAAEKAANRTMDDIPSTNAWMNETFYGEEGNRTKFDGDPPSQPPESVSINRPLITRHTALGILLILLAIGIIVAITLKQPSKETIVVAENGVAKIVTSGRFPMTSTHLGAVNGAWPGASGGVTCWKPLLTQVVDDKKPWVDCSDPNKPSKSRAIKKRAADGSPCLDITACEAVIP